MIFMGLLSRAYISEQTAKDTNRAGLHIGMDAGHRSDRAQPCSPLSIRFVVLGA